MKSFHFYNDLTLTREERKATAIQNAKYAAVLLFVVPPLVLVLGIAVFVIIALAS